MYPTTSRSPGLDSRKTTAASRTPGCSRRADSISLSLIALSLRRELAEFLSIYLAVRIQRNRFYMMNDGRDHVTGQPLLDLCLHSGIVRAILSTDERHNSAGGAVLDRPGDDGYRIGLVNFAQVGFDFFKLHSETEHFYLVVDSAEVMKDTRCIAISKIAGSIPAPAGEIWKALAAEIGVAEIA